MKVADGAEIPQNELENSMAFNFKYRSFTKKCFQFVKSAKFRFEKSDRDDERFFVLILMELNRKIFDKMAQESIAITYFLNYF